MSLPEYPLTLAVFEREYPDFWEILGESSESHIPDFRAFLGSLGESYPLNIGILGAFSLPNCYKNDPPKLALKADIWFY
jgi:hypothetical protein